VAPDERRHSSPLEEENESPFVGLLQVDVGRGEVDLVRDGKAA
jgi:hypothetical protein